MSQIKTVTDPSTVIDTRDARAPENILSSSDGMGLSFEEHIVTQTDN